MLNRQLVRISGPIHSSNVVIARVARDQHPARGAAFDIYHTHTYRRVRGSRNWIRDIEDGRVATQPRIRKAGDDLVWGSEVVYQSKNLHAPCVKLPVRIVMPVGRPP